MRIVFSAFALLAMTAVAAAQTIGPPLKDLTIDNSNSRSVDTPCVQLKKLEGFCVGVAPENQSPEKAIKFCTEHPQPPWPSDEQQKLCKEAPK